MGRNKHLIRLQEEAIKGKVKVIRNGKVVEITTGEVVVGDIVILNSGDKIPADGVLISGNLSVDESALNGESKEAKKKINSKVYRGSVVYNGNAKMQVELVGDKTIMGKISQELQEDIPESPLRLN